MLKENGAIMKPTSDVVKKEKDTLKSGQTVVLEPKVIAEKSIILKSDVDIYLIVGEYCSSRETILKTWLF